MSGINGGGESEAINGESYVGYHNGDNGAQHL